MQEVRPPVFMWKTVALGEQMCMWLPKIPTRCCFIACYNLPHPSSLFLYKLGLVLSLLLHTSHLCALTLQLLKPFFFSCSLCPCHILNFLFSSPFCTVASCNHTSIRDTCAHRHIPHTFTPSHTYFTNTYTPHIHKHTLNTLTY